MPALSRIAGRSATRSSPDGADTDRYLVTLQHVAEMTPPLR